MNNLNYTIHDIGDSCISFKFSDIISKEVSDLIIRIYRALKEERIRVHDIVPAYNELAIHFDPLSVKREYIIEKVEKCIENPSAGTHLFNKFEFPVKYDGEDLSELCELHDMSKKELIEIHTAPVYTVAMIGFRPNFPYLLGMDKRIETPRRKEPRVRIPAGTVAIGGLQTGIYSLDGPGGWNIIGSTEIGLLKEVKPGDTIKFWSN